ncbi:DUF3168 domain-containing protein [Paracoccus litorisediminis]|uniref:DUF3168 domain-containing protein n=1 Tax=Paracoccus litorisediminis TaxID=2006130 RepID=UPI00372FBA3E
MGVESVLRQMIQDRIIAQVGDVGGRVYDKPTEGEEFPHVSMGPSYWVRSDVQCVDGKAWTVQVDIWHREVDKGIAGDVTEAVEDALNGWADTSLLTMTPFRVTLVRQMDDPDGVSTHGVVQVETRVETSS